MKVDKISANSWRIRKMYKGKTYNVYCDHKPSQKEAMELLSEAMDETAPALRGTFSDAYQNYVMAKANVLSPSTLRTYGSMFKVIPDNFKILPLKEITNLDIQKVINEHAINHTPKSTHNLYGLITAVLTLFYPSLHISVTLPQKVKHEPYIPTESEVKALLDKAQGTRYEVPFILAAFYSLRRSEIMALKYPDDLTGNILTVNKAVVKGTEGWVTKTTKTVESTRQIYLSDKVVNLIHEQKSFYEGSPDRLYHALTQWEDELGMEHFSFHKLRHFFASYAHNNHLTDEQIQKIGGWKNSAVLESVYKHAMDLEESQKKLADITDKLF